MFRARVVEMKITSPEWEPAPGVRVGMDKGEAEALLGAPTYKMAETGKRAFFYLGEKKKGAVFLTFRAERLIEVHWMSPPCSSALR
jgi:outer membrane protein assembly factor BamE (lipoprotein component of BamABCDE complex)